MSELTCLELSVVLWLVHVLVQASFGNAHMPSRYLLGSRDEPAEARGVVYGRSCRALGNYLENFTPFVAVALALIATQRTVALGPSAPLSGSSRASSIFRLRFRHYLCTYNRVGDFIVGLVMMFGPLIGW